ncbi:hypothetical protein BD410DRAFT_521635 [Rickenella mellea]|uniref:HNH nuclease domain-containing protein n=1 Tax=Rickenella mellea TaxID=50990 RepID=A0A4Y7QI05_9AGAM|nr:hypothetical protein BD410DRAFT_521635 [Rickenella mellea]
MRHHTSKQSHYSRIQRPGGAGARLEPLSEFSVASVDDTTVLLDPAIQRDINFRTDVLARDNNECAMIRRFNKPTSVSTEPNTIEDDASGTNALDEDVPGEESSDDDASIDESSSDAGEAPDADSPSYAASAGLKLNLNACHIIKHALAVQKKNSKAIFFTWDILRYYAAISDETLSNLQTVIDSTANGITLEKTMHSEFDDFNVVFVPTNKKHTYQIRWLNEKHFFYTLAGRDTVKFRDHTRQHQRPKPKFLALHRAIAHVLHETKLVATSL